MAKATVDKYVKVNLELTEDEVRFLNQLLNVNSSGDQWYWKGQRMDSLPKVLKTVSKELNGETP